jgi:hypothetical protein
MGTIWTRGVRQYLESGRLYVGWVQSIGNGDDGSAVADELPLRSQGKNCARRLLGPMLLCPVRNIQFKSEQVSGPSTASETS